MSKYDEALSFSAALCSSSEQCAMDIMRKIEKLELNFEDKIQIVNTLKLNGFLNDDRYVKAFINDKFKFSKWGKVKIANMLRQKGFDASTIENGIELIDKDDYIETLLEILNQKRKSTKSKSLFDLRNKMFRFAISRGFETSVTINCLKSLNLNQDDEDYEY